MRDDIIRHNQRIAKDQRMGPYREFGYSGPNIHDRLSTAVREATVLQKKIWIVEKWSGDGTHENITIRTAEENANAIAEKLNGGRTDSNREYWVEGYLVDEEYQP